MEEWKRKQLHSHVYRVPEPFQDEVVVVVGGSLNGSEIALELVHVAKEVHISTKHVEIPHKLVKPVAKYTHLLGHQQCHVEDVRRQVDEAVQNRHKIDKMFVAFTGQPLEVIQKYIERDRYFSAAEAMDFGLIDGVLETLY